MTKNKIVIRTANHLFMRYASTHFVIMISGFFFKKKKIEKELRIEDLIYDKEVLFSLNKKKLKIVIVDDASAQ